MMGVLNRDCIPAWAVTMWATERDIIVALPMTAGGTPYLLKYPLSEGGLSEALRVLKLQAPEAPRPTAASPANYTIPHNQPMVKTSKAHEQLVKETTEAQREAARRLVAKLGLK